MGRKLVYICQLVQVPDDAGSVIGSTHKDAVGHRCSKAGHCLSVPIQSLVEKKQLMNHNRVADLLGTTVLLPFAQ